MTTYKDPGRPEYLNTGVWMGKGSALALAVAENKMQAAALIFKQTSAAYAKLYSAEDRHWFANWREIENVPDSQTDAAVAAPHITGSK